MIHSKPYNISKHEVLNAWLRVKKKGGSGGVDGVEVDKFEENLKDNLYKLWNRMSSGSYFPSAVRRVEIPKLDGTIRPLGIPTVYDRVAQGVVRARLEPECEKIFHEDSYGFRPKKSAHQAISVCRQRNFDNDWTIDLDIAKYFDTIDHELLLKAVDRHCPESWLKLYIERWLKAKICLPNGETVEPEAGTPQGGVISPLLANIFLHYVFDKWMQRTYPRIKFERYADDIVIHCKTQREAQEVLKACEDRFASCKLKLHPDKTQIVYNKDTFRKRKGYPMVSYTFLGFVFRARRTTSRRTGCRLSCFLPSVSPRAKKRARHKIKEQLHRRTLLGSPHEVARSLNQGLRGWLNYFNPFSTIQDLADVSLYIKLRFTNWIQRKYRMSRLRACRWLKLLLKRFPKFITLPQSQNNYGWIGRAV